IRMTPILQMLVLASMAASVGYLGACATALLVLAFRARGHHGDLTGDRQMLSASRFTIPVSIIVRAGESYRPMSATVEALLAQNYPELEVILIAEELSPAVWERLKQEWKLEPREVFYRAALKTAAVRMIYRSARDARVIAVDKAPAPAADALNAGVNLARFR